MCVSIKYLNTYLFMSYRTQNPSQPYTILKIVLRYRSRHYAVLSSVGLAYRGDRVDSGCYIKCKQPANHTAKANSVKNLIP